MSTETPQPAEPRPVLSGDAATAQQRVLALRGKTEYFYAQMRQREKSAASAQRDGLAAEQKAAARAKAFLLEIIRVADSFDDVFRMVEEDKALKKQSAVADCFRTTHDTLLHVLENHGVHSVPVVGKRYGEIEFEGQPIPEPWTVAGGQPGDKRVATKVLRALWVLRVGEQLTVLRRATVSYG